MKLYMKIQYFTLLHTVYNKMSKGLSSRLSTFNENGNHLNDNSKYSEKTLQTAIDNFIIPYTTLKLQERFQTKKDEKTFKVYLKKNISLYECQEHFASSQGLTPEEYSLDKENKKYCMKPDGGILYVKINNDKCYPILITEDKIQGTNDLLFKKGIKKQATGNALERAIKNIRGCEMLFDNMRVFPYLIFASGCDLHPSETISKRLEMGNYGVPNHNIVIEPKIKTVIEKEEDKDKDKDWASPNPFASAKDKEKDEEEQEKKEQEFQRILENININKRFKGKSIANIFVKSHKYDLMPHGSSKWTVEEITSICCKVIDLVLDELEIMLSSQSQSSIQK